VHSGSASGPIGRCGRPSGPRAGASGRAHTSVEEEKGVLEGIKAYDSWGRLVIERKLKEKGAAVDGPR
jgi:hypothetical protein